MNCFSRRPIEKEYNYSHTVQFKFELMDETYCFFFLKPKMYAKKIHKCVRTYVDRYFPHCVNVNVNTRPSYPTDLMVILYVTCTLHTDDPNYSTTWYKMIEKTVTKIVHGVTRGKAMYHGCVTS